MQHGKHSHTLGREKENRKALMANLAVALIIHGKIRTTLAKAKAIRPFIEPIITLAKKAHMTENVADKLHFRRMAISRLRDVVAARILFDEKVVEFLKRNGGYTRIYKLFKRVGDGADMAIIELVKSDDAGYSRSRRKRRSSNLSDKKTIEMAKEEILEPVVA